VTRTRQLFAAAAIITVQLAANARAQEKPAALVPAKLQVAIARYQGDRRVSNLPFTLAVDVGGGKASLRSGMEVPMVTSKTDDKGTSPSIQYRAVGTNIDASITSLADGRFRVYLTVEDSSVYGDDQAALAAVKNPAITMFRSFRWGGELILGDNQSSQFMTATDKLNGEVTKVDVTLALVK
jgi:hypothetical protein